MIRTKALCRHHSEPGQAVGTAGGNAVREGQFEDFRQVQVTDIVIDEEGARQGRQ
ncbi:hypothetical protein D3C76_1838820 [compost metagenome]